MKLKNRLQNKVNEINQEILTYLKNRKESDASGLYDGYIGISLFLIQYFRYNSVNNEDVNIIISELVTEFISSFNKFSFCSGLSGGLYLFELLKEHDILEIDTEEIIDKLEEYLNNNLDVEIKNMHYDFMHGALGIGFYFLKTSNFNGINKIVNYLYDTAVHDKFINGFKWTSDINYSGKISYNISLSHGISSIVIFLSKVVEKGGECYRAIELLKGSINYIISQEIDYKTHGSFFPNRSKSNSFKSRLAWCYGDLGVALALWKAGNTLNRDDLKKKAVSIMLMTTHRKLDSETDIIEAGICHGTSGLAMIYNRMFLNTKMNQFSEASEYWIEQTLNFSKLNVGLAGYNTFCDNKWENDFGLLSGISGIGTVALSYLNDDDQYWDEIFLL